MLLTGLSATALGPVLRALDAVAALDEDVTSLMTAVPALVRAIRYGTVRGTPSGSLSAVVDALVIRICAALPGSVGGLADDAAARLREAMDGLHAALGVYGTAAPGAGSPVPGSGGSTRSAGSPGGGTCTGSWPGG